MREGEGPSTVKWWSVESPALKRSKDPDSAQDFYNVTLEEGDPLQRESSTSYFSLTMTKHPRLSSTFKE